MWIYNVLVPSIQGVQGATCMIGAAESSDSGDVAEGKSLPLIKECYGPNELDPLTAEIDSNDDSVGTSGG